MAHHRGNQVVKQWSEPENICFTPFKVIWSEGKAIAIDLRKLSCFYQNDHCQCWNNYSSSLRYHDVEHYVEGQVDFNLFLRFLSWNSILSPLFLLRSEFFPSLSAADCKNPHERDLDRKSLYSYSILQVDDKEPGEVFRQYIYEIWQNRCFQLFGLFYLIKNDLKHPIPTWEKNFLVESFICCCRCLVAETK